MTTTTDGALSDAEYEKRSEWLIETLIARDFDIPEFHALQTEIAARWQHDRRRLDDALIRAGASATAKDAAELAKEREQHNDTARELGATFDALAELADIMTAAGMECLALDRARRLVNPFNPFYADRTALARIEDDR